MVLILEQMNAFYPQGQNQFQQQQQQVMMTEPPKMISTKDHLYLKDAMSWELTSMKCCYHFAREARDPEVQMLLDRTGQMHLNHYLRLLDLVQSAHMTNH